jgi:GTP-binding protein
MDKVPRTRRIKHEKEIKRVLQMESTDTFIPYSSETKENKEAVWATIKNFI